MKDDVFALACGIMKKIENTPAAGGKVSQLLGNIEVAYLLHRSPDIFAEYLNEEPAKITVAAEKATDIFGVSILHPNKTSIRRNVRPYMAQRANFPLALCSTGDGAARYPDRRPRGDSPVFQS